MKYCGDLDRHLTGTLAGMERMEFDNHLNACDRCRDEVRQWKKMKERVEDWSSEFTLPKPTQAEGAELVMGLRPKKTPLLARRPVWIATAAAAAVLAVAIGFGTGIFGGPIRLEGIKRIELDTMGPLPIRVVYSTQSEIPSTDEDFAKRLVVSGKGRLIFELGLDRIALSANTEMEIVRSDGEETRLRIERGEAAVKVEPRTDGGSFVIEADDCEVKVMGTRFKVRLIPDSKMAVAVDEGNVVVSGPGETVHQLRAGQVLRKVQGEGWHYDTVSKAQARHIAKLLTPPDAQFVKRANPGSEEIGAPYDGSGHGHALDPIETWRAWILEKRYKEAEAAMLNHLRSHPGDFATLSLLAGCRSKAGNFVGAVKIYERIIRGGGKNMAASARFDAAVILQDKLGRHEKAAAHLKNYLKHSPLLEAEAMFRLATAWLKMGKSAKGESMLHRIKENHSGTTTANRAAELLDKLNSSEPS